MKNSPQVNSNVAVAQKNEAAQRLARVILVAYVVVGVISIVELQIAGFLALTF
jgi:hypothetical protein